VSAGGYEQFFGLAERPFSLTSDEKYFFSGRSHARALETVLFGLRRRERLLLVTGAHGVGKTVLCRTMLAQHRRHASMRLITNPLLSAEELLRRLLNDVRAIHADSPACDQADTAPAFELHTLLRGVLQSAVGDRDGGVIVIDDAHRLPASLAEHLLLLAGERKERPAFQVVLVGEGAAGEHGALGIPLLDEQISTKASLLPLGRDECGRYVSHRLAVAGSQTAAFSPRAIDTLYGLSGGTPRLVNLLCERALQEAAATNVRRIESPAVQAAASALQLLRSRQRRFRWYTRRAV
jgi:general secretion pathway protein A